VGEYRWVFTHVGFFCFWWCGSSATEKGNPMEKRDPSVAVPILLIADSDVRRRGELRRLFSSSGFRVVAASDGLRCLGELVALEADVLVIALEIPWGGGDGVIARLKDGLPIGRKPLILVIGETPVETLSARTGVAPCNCFSKPLRKEDLLDRIGMELGVRLLRGAEDRQWPWEESTRRTLLEEGVR
jgi:FixJ family two-component response regulator